MIGHTQEDRSPPRCYTIISRRWPRRIRARFHLGVAATAAVAFMGFTGAQAHAGEKDEKEPVAIIELGGAAEWAFTGETSLGPSAAVEFEPIKDWLEIKISRQGWGCKPPWHNFTVLLQKMRLAGNDGSFTPLFQGLPSQIRSLRCKIGRRRTNFWASVTERWSVLPPVGGLVSRAQLSC
jgi:hypothetical protein